MALDNHTFTVLGQYRIITMVLGREPTMSEFMRFSDYSRYGFFKLRRVHPEFRELQQSQEEEKLMKHLYEVLKTKYNDN